MSIVQVLQNYAKNNWLKFGNDWLIVSRSGDFLRTDFEIVYFDIRGQNGRLAHCKCKNVA